jgi:hypothetical protein
MAGMKNLIRLLTASFLAAALSPSVVGRAQSLPNAPAPQSSAPPAPLPDSAWDRVLSLARGQPIVVASDYGPPAHCLFAGATAAFLFCDPPGNPPGVGYRFDRASVISVTLDQPLPTGAQFSQPHPNYHPFWLSSIVAGGLLVGICATRTMDAGDSARAGAIGALVVGAIGAPLAFLPQSPGEGLIFHPFAFARARSPRLARQPLQPLGLVALR